MAAFLDQTNSCGAGSFSAGARMINSRAPNLIRVKIKAARGFIAFIGANEINREVYLPFGGVYYLGLCVTLGDAESRK